MDELTDKCLRNMLKHCPNATEKIQLEWEYLEDCRAQMISRGCWTKEKERYYTKYVASMARVVHGCEGKKGMAS